MAPPPFAMVAPVPSRSRSAALISGAARSTAVLENHAAAGQIRAVRNKTSGQDLHYSLRYTRACISSAVILLLPILMRTSIACFVPSQGTRHRARLYPRGCLLPRVCSPLIISMPARLVAPESAAQP